MRQSKTLSSTRNINKSAGFLLNTINKSTKQTPIKPFESEKKPTTKFIILQPRVFEEIGENNQKNMKVSFLNTISDVCITQHAQLPENGIRKNSLNKKQPKLTSFRHHQKTMSYA